MEFQDAESDESKLWWLRIDSRYLSPFLHTRETALFLAHFGEVGLLYPLRLWAWMLEGMRKADGWTDQIEDIRWQLPRICAVQESQTDALLDVFIKSEVLQWVDEKAGVVRVVHWGRIGGRMVRQRLRRQRKRDTGGQPVNTEDNYGPVSEESEAERQMMQLLEQRSVIGSGITKRGFVQGWLKTAGAPRVHEVLMSPNIDGWHIIDVHKMFFQQSKAKPQDGTRGKNPEQLKEEIKQAFRRDKELDDGYQRGVDRP